MFFQYCTVKQSMGLLINTNIALCILVHWSTSITLHVSRNRENLVKLTEPDDTKYMHIHIADGVRCNCNSEI